MVKISGSGTFVSRHSLPVKTNRYPLIITLANKSRVCGFAFASIIIPVVFLQADGIVPAERLGPNILLILADDFGWGDTSSYSPESPIKTPHIDRLAKDGIRLTNAHVAGGSLHADSLWLAHRAVPVALIRQKTGAQILCSRHDYQGSRHDPVFPEIT